MQVCECQNPQPRPYPENPGQKVCATCGQWWMPQHGSRRPAAFKTITDADWARELPVARSTPNLIKAKIRSLTEEVK